MTRRRISREQRLVFVGKAPPANPPPRACVVFLDRLTGKIKVKKADGTIVSLEG